MVRKVDDEPIFLAAHFVWHEGEVDWFYVPVGYGFLKSSATDNPIFFHHLNVVPVKKCFMPGEKLFFTMISTKDCADATMLFTEERYARRLLLREIGQPFPVNRLLANEIFREEIEEAFWQLPWKVLPNRKWVIYQLLALEKLGLDRTQVHEIHLRIVEERIRRLQCQFWSTRRSFEQILAQVQAQSSGCDREAEIYKVFRARFSSMRPVLSKRLAMERFKELQGELSAFMRSREG